jgi:hypothetical protein
MVGREIFLLCSKIRQRAPLTTTVSKGTPIQDGIQANSTDENLKVYHDYEFTATTERFTRYTDGKHLILVSARCLQ